METTENKVNKSEGHYVEIEPDFGARWKAVEADTQARLESLAKRKKVTKTFVFTRSETNNHDNTFNTFNLVFKTKRAAMAAMKIYVEQVTTLFPEDNVVWYDNQTCSIYSFDERSESRYVIDYSVRETLSFE